MIRSSGVWKDSTHTSRTSWPRLHQDCPKEHGKAL